MFRYFIAILLCVIFLGSNITFAADTVNEIRPKITKLLETPFSGTAQEFPDYVENLGNEILTLVDPLLKNTDLSQEDKQYLYYFKRVALQLRYALDNEEYEKKYEEFLAQVQDYALYRRWLSLRFDTIYRYPDKAERIAVFTSLINRLAPLVNKYCDDEKRTSNDQLPSIIVGTAEYLDRDGSLKLLRSTVEKLRPILEIDANRPQGDLLRFCAQRSLNSLRRLDMVGKPIEFAPFDTDNHQIDMAAFKGKVVLIVSTPRQQEKEELAPLEKLYETLKDKGLEVILFSNDDPEIAKERFKSNGESWIVASRLGGRASKDWIDYTECFGTHLFSIIVDREGIVRYIQSDGVTADLYEAVEPFFPEQRANVAKIIEEVRHNDEARDKRIAETMRKRYSLDDEGASPTLKKLIRINEKISETGLTDIHLTSVNLILADESLTPERRGTMLNNKVKILESLASKTLANQPELRPEIAFAEMEKLVDELLHANEDTTPPYNLFYAKYRIPWSMQAHLETMKSGHEEYADEITRRFVALVKQFPSNYSNINEFVYVYSDTLEDVDAKYSTQLLKSFLKEVIPLFEEQKAPEYHQNAQRLKNVLRRLELIDSEMEFETVLADGTKINVKDLRGKVVVVNFWNTACGPCLREFPHMKKMYEKYKPQGYEMIAYSCGDDEETLNGFIAKHDYPWLFGSMLKSVDAGLTNYDTHYGITGVPTTMILDRSGKVRFMMVGSNDEIFTRELEKRFAEEPSL